MKYRHISPSHEAQLHLERALIEIAGAAACGSYGELMGWVDNVIEAQLIREQVIRDSEFQREWEAVG